MKGLAGRTALGVPEGPGAPGMVSVVIPTYNRAAYLGAAIESALSQTYQPIEVVVVDDGSTDATATVVAGFGSRVRYFHQANGGVAAARNVGLRESRGELIAFLDSDDRWYPWKIAAQVSLLRARPDVGMVWTDMTAVDGQGGVTHPRYLRLMYSAYDSFALAQAFPEQTRLARLCPEIAGPLGDQPVHIGSIYKYMWIGNLVHTSTVLIRRDWAQRVGGFDEAMRPAGEDYLYFFETSACGPVALLDTSSTLYRVGDADQITAPWCSQYRYRATLKIARETLEHPLEPIALPPSLIAERLAGAYEGVGEEELRVGDRGQARRHLWTSLRYRPWQPRCLVYLLFSLLPAAAFNGALALKHALGGGRRARAVTKPSALRLTDAR